MRAATRAGRYGLLLALLLVLGVTTAVAPGGRNQVPHDRMTGESLSTSPSARDDFHDWLRVSGVARSVLATARPDTAWAFCPRVTDGNTPWGRTLVGAVDDTGPAAAVSTSRSSRAPPTSVNTVSTKVC